TYNYWNGSAWEKRSHPNPITEARAGTANFIAPFILDPNNPNRLLAGAPSLWGTDNARVPKSDGWPEWRVIKSPAGDARANNISAIAVAPGNSDRIWVGHSNGDIFVTTSGTAASPSWTKVDDGATPLPNRFVTRIAVDPRDSNVAYAAFGGFSANNLWKTSDGGASWSPLTGSGERALPQVPIETIAIHPNNSRWLYVGTEVGVFSSEDGGATWNVPQEGPANVSVKELFWIGTTLYAATFGRGMYKVDIPTASKGALACYTLTALADDDSRGGVIADVQPNCTGATQYTAGSVVHLRARPHKPYSFASWSSGETSRTLTVTTDRDRTVSAQFAATAACFPFTMTITPAGSGSVTLDPPSNCPGGYLDGTERTFYAHDR